MNKLKIIYEDRDLLVVDKPAGMLCVPGLSEPTNLFDLVKELNPNARVVHRLDMATSGLVLFPLNYEMQRGLAKQFESKQIQKKYIATVNGKVVQKFGEIHSNLICDWPNRPRQKIDWLSGKKSTTFFERIAHDEEKNCSRILLKPITGRSHQLRLHMLQIGHPIVGDKLYNSDVNTGKQDRMYLHARAIKFTHSLTKKNLLIECKETF